MLCVAYCGLSVRCNWRNASPGRVLEAKTGAQELVNSGAMGELALARRPLCLQPRHGPLTCSQCSANTEQEGNDVVLKARSRVLAFNSSEHPDGLVGYEKLRLKAGGWRGGQAPRGGKEGAGSLGAGRQGARACRAWLSVLCAGGSHLLPRSLIRVCSTDCVHDALGR